MPRTIAVDSPGCPPVRALTTDVLGLVKVVEARGKAGTPKVVQTWGPPDASRSVIAASYADRKNNPLLAVARSNGSVELLNPLNGDNLATIKVDESCSSCLGVEDAVTGLHLLGTKNIEFSSKLVTFLTCTSNGKACLRSILTGDASSDSTDTSPSTWDVCNSGKVTCSSVDASENYALFAGKNIEINVWDIEKRSKIWTAKSPPRNSIGIFSPTWFTAATFLDKDDHRKIAAGTNNYQLRLYDISAQRRPVISVTFRESPIKVVTEDPDGYRIYIGTGSGDLASFDMRTGKLLGCFVGKCSGSIRSIVRHPEIPLIASCGLDRYLRIWDTETRKPLSAVFLKQHLTNVVIDSHFSAEESPVVSACQANDPQEAEDGEVDDAEEFLPGSMSKKKERSKNKTKKRKNKGQEDDLVDEGLPSSSVESDVNIEKKTSRKSRLADEKEQGRVSKHKGKKSKSSVKVHP